MSESFKKRTVDAFVWSTIERTTRFVVRFGITVVLARILTPEDYGLIGMVLIFLSLDNSFVESGFKSALIQKKEVDDDDLSTVFWFNIAISILFYAALYFAAPLIARFYDTEVLTGIIRLLAIVPILASLSIVQNVQFIRKLDFKKITLIGFLSSTISGLVAIYMAYRGMGVWSLVAQRILQQFLAAVIMVMILRWVPRLIFSFHKFKQLFSFGSKLLLTYLLNSVTSNLYNVLIGKFYSARDLGFYTRAYSFQQMPLTNISGIIQQVLFPVFSRIQDEKEKIKSGTRMINEVTSFIIFPLMLCMAAAAKPLFILIFSDKWLPSVPYFQILAVGGLFYIMSVINLNILISLGYATKYLVLDLVKKGLFFLSVFGLIWDIKGLVIGAATYSLLEFFINASMTKRLIGYSIRNQLSDIAPYLLISIPVVGLIILLNQTGIPYLRLIIIQVISGTLLYLGICYALKVRALGSLKVLFITIRNKNQSTGSDPGL